MANPRAYPGGHHLFNEGERLGYTDLNTLAQLGLRSMLHVLSQVFWDNVNIEPHSGFFGTSCRVTASGLDVTVAAGIGFYYDVSETDDWESHYKVIWVNAADTETLSAHDPTNPRIDVLSLSPATDDDQSVSDNIKDPSTGTVTTSTINTRRRWSYTLTVTEGTPASSPTVPSTPSGAIKVAEALVPASSGAVTLYDRRPLLKLGADVAGGPGSGFVENFVPGTGDECRVEADGTGMTVFIDAGNEGDVVIDGHRHRVNLGRVTLSASDPTFDRFDLIAFYNDGTLSKVTGTPAASPVDPAIPAGAIALARVWVVAGVTVIIPPRVIDIRERSCIGNDQLQDSAVSSDKIGEGEVTATKDSVVAVIPSLTVNAEVANVITVDVQMKDRDAGTYAGVVRLRCILREVNMEPTGGVGTLEMAETGAGTRLSYTNQPVSPGYYGMLIDTDANGAAQLSIEDLTTTRNQGVWLEVTPVNTPGFPAIVDLPFST